MFLKFGFALSADRRFSVSENEKMQGPGFGDL